MKKTKWVRNKSDSIVCITGSKGTLEIKPGMCTRAAYVDFVGLISFWEYVSVRDVDNFVDDDNDPENGNFYKNITDSKLEGFINSGNELIPVKIPPGCFIEREGLTKIYGYLVHGHLRKVTDLEAFNSPEAIVGPWDVKKKIPTMYFQCPECGSFYDNKPDADCCCAKRTCPTCGLQIGMNDIVCCYCNTYLLSKYPTGPSSVYQGKVYISTTEDIGSLGQRHDPCKSLAEILKVIRIQKLHRGTVYAFGTFLNDLENNGVEEVIGEYITVEVLGPYPGSFAVGVAQANKFKPVNTLEEAKKIAEKYSLRTTLEKGKISIEDGTHTNFKSENITINNVEKAYNACKELEKNVRIKMADKPRWKELEEKAKKYDELVNATKKFDLDKLKDGFKVKICDDKGKVLYESGTGKGKNIYIEPVSGKPSVIITNDEYNQFNHDSCNYSALICAARYFIRPYVESCKGDAHAAIVKILKLMAKHKIGPNDFNGLVDPRRNSFMPKDLNPGTIRRTVIKKVPGQDWEE